VNVLALFGVDNGHDNLAEDPEGHEPSLGIGEPVIFVRVGHTLEHLLSVDEIESVLVEVPPSLGSSHVITYGVYMQNAYASRDGAQTQRV